MQEPDGWGEAGEPTYDERNALPVWAKSRRSTGGRIDAKTCSRKCRDRLAYLRRTREFVEIHVGRGIG